MPKKTKNEYTKYDPETDVLDYCFSFNKIETKKLKKIMKNNSAIDMSDIRRIVLWKYDRTVDFGDKEDAVIEKLNKLKTKCPLNIDDDCVKDVLADLVESKGIGYPVASAILKMIRPDVFPIIDRRAYRALTGDDFDAASCDYNQYMEYRKCLVELTKQIRERADHPNLNLNEMDEQLYEFDDEHNGPLFKKTKKVYTKYDPKKNVLDYEFSYNEPETTKLKKRMKNNSAIDMDDIRRIVLWKYNRTVDFDDKKDAVIEKLNKLKTKCPLNIDDDCVKDVLEDLVESKGIGYPVASAILKMIRPDVFPIIDRRAYRALTGDDFEAASCDYNQYMEYRKCLVKLAKRLNRPLSEMDEQLYEFDKEHNGPL